MNAIVTRQKVLSILVGGSLLLVSSLQAATWGSVRANNRSRENISREHAAPAVRAPERPRVVEHGRAEAFDRGRALERGRELARVSHENRHLDLDGDRRRAFYWSHYRPGFAVGVLPTGWINVGVGGVPYYYYQGVYYQQAPTGYVVSAPPIGAVVPQLPPGVETIVAGNVPYYYAGGAFYVQEPQGFVVVNPPPGLTVSDLPDGAVPTTINGMLYYAFAGTYFMPVMQNGVTAYVTAQP